MRRRLVSALVALVLLLGACSDSGDDTAGGDQASVTTTAATPTTGGAEEVAPVDPAIVADVEAELVAWMAESAPPVPGASISILLPGGQQIDVAEGVADLRTDTPVATTDYFRIGSITKTITTIAILQLVEEGKVALDEPVATYLGEEWITGYELEGVDYADKVTVRDVLSHTDGFKEYAWDVGFYLQTADRLDRPYEPQEILDWGAAQKPQYVPGTDYSYNTVGHVAAGLIIEEVTGNPAHEELDRRIFEPLGLDNIFLPPKSTPPQPVVHGYAIGILLDALKMLPQVGAYEEQGLVGANGEYFDMLSLPQEAISSAGWTAGGIEAQVAAVPPIFRAAFDGTLLDEASVSELTTPNAFSDYALGLEVDETLGHTAYEHGGGVPGFRSYAVYYPELDIALAISVNAIPVDPDVDALVERILKVLTADGPPVTTDS